VPMNYARSRLMLGVTTVGFWVVISLLMIVSQATTAPFQPLSLGVLASVLIVVGAYILLSVPFDLLGGFILPTRFGRSSQKLPCYLIGWLRGAILHGTLLGLAGLFLLELYRSPSITGASGLWYVLAFSIVGQTVLLLAQPFVARLLAHFDVSPSEDASGTSSSALWHCTDIGFTGGLPVAGSPSILPERWLQALTKLEFALLQERRSFIRGSHMYPLGIMCSFVLNALGALLAHVVILQQGWFPSAIGNLGFLTLWASITSLWAFLGLITLPPLSQWATLYADKVLIVHLDTLQDEEYIRPPAIQRVFHPIASVQQRMDAINANGEFTGLAAYNVARLCLYLSWVNMSFMSRAVHCNVGRPHLWVFLPIDG
jgi:hypothetical protein